MTTMNEEQRAVVEAFLRTFEAGHAAAHDNDHPAAELVKTRFAAIRVAAERAGNLLAALYPAGLENEAVFSALCSAANHHYRQAHDLTRPVGGTPRAEFLIFALTSWGLMPGQPGSRMRRTDRVEGQTREGCEYQRDKAIEMVHKVFDAIEYDENGVARGEVRAIRTVLEPPIEAKQRVSHSLLFFYTPTGSAHAWEDG